MTDAPPPEPRFRAQFRLPRFRLRASIATAMVLGFGALILLGVGGALAIGLWSASQNTMSLLADKAEIGIGALVGDLRRHLDAVRAGNEYLARLIAEGEVDPKDRLQLADYMTGTMAATPQILGIGFVGPDLEMMRVSRDAGRIGISIVNRQYDKDLQAVMRDARMRAEPYWGNVIWAKDVGATMVNLRAPIRRNNKFIGLLISAVTVDELSRLLGKTDVRPDIADRFILYDGTYVLAHRSMTDGRFSRSVGQPLPALDQIGDPVLAQLWNPEARRKLAMKLSGETKGHVIARNGTNYPVLYRQVAGYGAAPLTVGAYIRPGPARGGEVRRLIAAAAIGIAILVVSLVIAVVLGRRVSRPVRQLARAASAVGNFDFVDMRPLPRSRFREIDDAARAFNDMTAGLRWFENYVPRRLVRQLIAQGEGAEIRSEVRHVTVMFTDIAGFSHMAVELTAPETAALLNRHFSLLAACIEAEDGTVDKYIGDSVMAFWGPPLVDAGHVARACRAATAIRETLAADNRARAQRGEKPIRIRIGLHAGLAIVGNIGAPGRINYTLIGDTVNIAQRLEELGKTIGKGSEDAVILVSAEVADTLAGALPVTSVGAHEIRGHDGEFRVYRLD